MFDKINISDTSELLGMSELLKYYLDHTYDGLVIADKHNRIIYANKAVERISGIPLDDILGKDNPELLKEGVVLTSRHNTLKNRPLTIIQRIKTGVEVVITSVPVYDNVGDLVCYIANYRDLRELNKLKDTLDSKNNIHMEDNIYAELKSLRKKALDSDDIVIKNNKMKELIETVINVAKVDTNVLILGETGTGKEVISKMLHKYSYRKDGPFIQVNCSAIPSELLESELFGYEKGAFTGAQKRKVGILEMANKGSVLLDEIGDMPISLQAKMLRVLEHKGFYRIGGLETIKNDIRIIAATNKNLVELVQQGLFREDLYHRLNIATINIPPLRERKNEIVPIACHFLKEFNKKYHVNKYFDIKTCNTFEKYDWPGNVRELKNLIEKICIFQKDDLITENCLPQHIIAASMSEVGNMPSLKEKKIEAEIDLIKIALSNSESIRGAARALKVHHTTLLRKMKRYNLSRS